jgi:hydrogenase expression/formation protein HypC
MCLGVPGKVLSFEDGDLRMGRVAFGQVVKEISLAFVPHAKVGEYVVVHAGMALDVIDEEAAQRVFAVLRELDAASLEELG